MSPNLYEFLGYSVGCLTAEIVDDQGIEKHNMMQTLPMEPITNTDLTTYETT
jgi:hypothetical protein